jgi:hypothetical protein
MLRSTARASWRFGTENPSRPGDRSQARPDAGASGISLDACASGISLDAHASGIAVDAGTSGTSLDANASSISYDKPKCPLVNEGLRRASAEKTGSTRCRATQDSR